MKVTVKAESLPDNRTDEKKNARIMSLWCVPERPNEIYQLIDNYDKNYYQFYSTKYVKGTGYWVHNATTKEEVLSGLIPFYGTVTITQER